jgi:hypothetical protein
MNPIIFVWYNRCYDFVCMIEQKQKTDFGHRTLYAHRSRPRECIRLRYGKDTIRASGQRRTRTKWRGATRPASTLLYPYPPRDALAFLLPPHAPCRSLFLLLCMLRLHPSTPPCSSTLCSASPSLHVRRLRELLLPPRVPSTSYAIGFGGDGSGRGFLPPCSLSLAVRDLHAWRRLRAR